MFDALLKFNAKGERHAVPGSIFGDGSAARVNGQIAQVKSVHWQCQQFALSHIMRHTQVNIHSNRL